MNLISNTPTQTFNAGYIAILGLIIIGITSLLGVSLINNVVDKTALQNKQIVSARALEIAEAGLQKAVYELNKNPSYAGEQNVSFGGGIMSISITNIDGYNKYVESVGSIIDSRSNIEKRVGAKVKTNTDMVSFYYGVQAGQGGLEMSNNSTVNGTVYSNGSVIGTTNSRVTGDLWVAGAGALNVQAQNIAQTQGFNIGAISIGQKIAQEFYASSTEIFAKVSFYIKKTGSPPNATVTLRNYHHSGWPIGNIIAQGTLQANQVGTNYAWVDITFNNNPLLINGTNYWVTIEMPSVSSTKYYTIGLSDNQYTEGDAMFYYPPDWENIEGDFTFKVYSGSNSQTKIDNVDVGGDAHATLIKDSAITGGAYYQSIQNSTAGSYYPGSPDPPLQNFPISDGQIQDWISDAVSGGVISGNYSPTTSISLGPKKINGDFTMVNGTTLTITGTIYVTGNINFSNNVIVRLDSSYGNNSGIIIAEGKITLSNGVTIQKINDTGYVMFVSKYARADDEAMNFGNNVTGGIHYAPYGSANISNNTNITEINADKIKLANNASITYETGLVNTNFSSGSGASWQLEKGSWNILK